MGSVKRDKRGEKFTQTTHARRHVSYPAESVEGQRRRQLSMGLHDKQRKKKIFEKTST